MMFLNAALLAGAAAALIPLIIHLLNRTRFKQVDWGAMHLLESALKINTRRWQWQARLLLWLRMLIPAVLAVCLARPVLTAWRTAAGGSEHSVVLVIDNSLSMEALAVVRGATENPTDNNSRRSCFDEAIAQARGLIERFGKATEITVLTAGGGVIDQTTGATFDSRRVLRCLREVRAGAGPAAIEEALATGLSRLAKAKQLRRHLILLSDFQRTEWENLSPDSLARLRASPQSQDAPIELTFIPIQHTGRENISVQIDRPLGPSLTTPKQIMEVRVAVRNHGRQRVTNLPVVLSAGGRALATKNVEIAGDSQIFLAFSCQLSTLGTHVLSVSIGDRPSSTHESAAAGRSSASATAIANPVTSDDVSRWSVEVIEPVRVGIVSTRAPNSRAIDDAVYLNLALSPFAVSLVGAAASEEAAGWAEAHAGADPIACEIVGPQEITQAWLADRQVVALMSVPQLDDSAALLLREFVHGGGMLMIWAGEDIDPQWYNTHWGNSGRDDLLAAQYGSIVRAQARSPATFKIQNQAYEHPALAFFNRSSNGRLDSLDFATWMQLELAPGAFPLLSLDNGQPLLVERPVGRGRVLQWAINAGQRWSNLPLREVFLPLVQQLVLYGATSAMPRLNLETGAIVAVELAGGTQDSARSQKGPAGNRLTQSAGPSSEIELLTPAGWRFRLEPQAPGAQPAVQFGMTHFPGVYQISGVRERPLAVAISSPARESILESLEEKELNEWARRLDAQIQSSADTFWEGELLKQTGRELWRPLLAALVLLLIAELWLQQSLTRTSP